MKVIGRLVGGADGDVHAEFFELAHEAVGLLLGRPPPIVRAPPEVLISHPISNDVVIRQ